MADVEVLKHDVWRRLCATNAKAPPINITLHHSLLSFHVYIPKRNSSFVTLHWETTIPAMIKHKLGTVGMHARRDQVEHGGQA